MANSSPHKARMAKRQLRKPGDLRALQRMLWRALLEAQEILDGAEEADMRLRAIHAISQASGQYGKLLEVGEFEARIAALEAGQKGQR
jgi:hypothetical protein